MLDKEFIPYEEALALKELGFNETCFAYWNADPSLPKPFLNLVKPFDHEWCIPTPLYQQAFRWFRDNYSYSHSITEHEIIEGQTDFLYIDENEEFQTVEWLARVHPSFIKAFKLYEEAELACLRKLIEIVKKEKQNG